MLHTAHDPDEIASPYFLELPFIQSFSHQPLRKVNIIGCRGQSGHSAITVKIGAYAHMVNTRHVYGMENVANGIVNACLSILGKEVPVERDLRHTVTLGDGLKLFVGEVAGMVAERTAGGV